jgi:hypothetical protein
LASKVYITMSCGVCQAQTRIQEQYVLGSNEKCGVLGFKHNVYSDSSTMCTQIGAQGCNQTRIQAQCVLGLDRQGIQIKASNCHQNMTRTRNAKRLNQRPAIQHN